MWVPHFICLASKVHLRNQTECPNIPPPKKKKKKHRRPPSCYFTLNNEIIFNKRRLVVEYHSSTLVHSPRLLAVPPNSQIRSTIMSLLIYEIGKYCVGVVENDAVKIVTKFGENWLSS
jgi:hypothetical protein